MITWASPVPSDQPAIAEEWELMLGMTLTVQESSYKNYVSIFQLFSLHLELLMASDIDSVSFKSNYGFNIFVGE